MPELHLVPECFAETEMVRILVNNEHLVNHGMGIGGVSNILKKEDVAHYINIGFVDNDKARGPKYFDEFNEYSAGSNVIVKKHPVNNDYLIVACPAIEKFILKQLAEIGKSPSDFGFPDDFKEFRKKLKNSNIKNNQEYKNMITELKNSDTTGFSFILETIKTLHNED